MAIITVQPQGMGCMGKNNVGEGVAFADTKQDIKIQHGVRNFGIWVKGGLGPKQPVFYGLDPINIPVLDLGRTLKAMGRPCLSKPDSRTVSDGLREWTQASSRVAANISIPKENALFCFKAVDPYLIKPIGIYFLPCKVKICPV